MTEPVNLNRFRKSKAQAEANQNAVRHGRTKAQRELEKTRAEKHARESDQHRLEP